MELKGFYGDLMGLCGDLMRFHGIVWWFIKNGDINGKYPPVIYLYLPSGNQTIGNPRTEWGFNRNIKSDRWFSIATFDYQRIYLDMRNHGNIWIPYLQTCTYVYVVNANVGYDHQWATNTKCTSGSKRKMRWPTAIQPERQTPEVLVIPLRSNVAF
jgi:hypothetical protein